MSTLITPSTVKKINDVLELVNKMEPHSTSWYEVEIKLENSLWRLRPAKAPTKEIRLQYYSSGIFELIFLIIKSIPGKHTDGVLEAAWGVGQNGVIVPDVHEKDNIETLTKGVELGFVELAVRELSFRPLRCGGVLMDYAFSALANPASYSNFTNHLIEKGVPRTCLQLIRDGGNILDEITRSNLTRAIRTLNNIARFNVESIRMLPGLVDAVKPYLRLLRRHDEGNDDDDDMIMLGFTVSKLLIKVYGKDDSSKIIMENPIILDFYPKFMRQVMDIGVNNNYKLFNTLWVLAGIALDLSLISTCNTNKQLLVPIVPLMLEMMLFHNNGDRDVIRYGVVFLSQIYLDEYCGNEIRCKQEWLKQIQEIINSDREFDKETVVLVRDVVSYYA
jgi:hypothetical protein